MALEVICRFKKVAENQRFSKPKKFLISLGFGNRRFPNTPRNLFSAGFLLGILSPHFLNYSLLFQISL